MSKGFTLLELMVVVAIAAVLLALGFPRAARLMDWIKTEFAVRDVLTALAIGRNGGCPTVYSRPSHDRHRYVADRSSRWTGMGAVVADARSVESRCRTRDIESRCDLWSHGDGVGRVEHDGRPAPRVSSRNDHDVAGWKGEALVDATVLRVPASNPVKLGCAAGRKSRGRGRSVTATSPDRQPRGASRPGVWSF